MARAFPDTDGPADVVRAAAEALLDGRNQYPPMTGLPELRQAVAAANARFYGLDVDPDAEVVVTSGATEALTACLMALLDPGDEVVLIEPLYDTYLPVVRLLGAVPRLVRLQPPDWELPRAELAAAFGPKTKAILFNTPMNPTGKVFTAAELAFIAELLARHDAYAICDEVYEHLTFDGWRHIPLMTLPGMRERCLRIGSAGKTFSLTGWKVGYITACRGAGGGGGEGAPEPHLHHPAQPAARGGLGLAKDDAYFRGLAAGLAGQARPAGRGAARIGFGVLPVQGSYFITADFAPLGWTGDDVAFCRHITEAGRRHRDPGHRLLRGRGAGPLRPLRLLQAPGGAGCGARAAGARISPPPGRPALTGRARSA